MFIMGAWREKQRRPTKQAVLNTPNLVGDWKYGFSVPPYAAIFPFIFPATTRDSSQIQGNLGKREGVDS